MNIRYLLSAFLAALCCGAVVAQNGPGGGDVLQWSIRAEPVAEGTPHEVDLVLEARIQAGWIVYASDFKRTDLGPLPSKLALGAGQSAVGALRAVGTSQGKAYTYFAKQALYRQRVRYDANVDAVTGVISGQACFEESGLCTLFKERFSVAVP